MNIGKVAAAFVVIVVGAALVAGLRISGSPNEQRNIRADRLRVANLQSLSSTIERYYRETRVLPADLGAVLNGWAGSEIPRDPETNQYYDYEIEGEQAYRLCATFARGSRPTQRVEFWSHPAGRQCFSFDYSELVLN